MAAKAKMRCARCGKPYKSANAKQIYCDACAAKVKLERSAQKQADVHASASTISTSPKIIGPGASILVPELAHAVPAAPASADHREPQTARPARLAMTPTHREPAPTASRAPRAHGAEGARPAKSPKRAPSLPELTEEMRARIEERYLELANPVEYDGIRTQISAELNVPKVLIKQAVRDLRVRLQLPSWWELQSYRGTDRELDRVRDLYVPYLPVPPIGVHRQIAEQLGLDSLAVYRAIRRIRAELRLPRFNPIEAHKSEAQTAPSGGSSDETARNAESAV